MEIAFVSRWHGLIFVPECGGNTFLRNVNKHLPDDTAAHPKKRDLFNTAAVRPSNLCSSVRFGTHLAGGTRSRVIILSAKTRFPAG
jgi:hypothetical protein